MTEFKSLDNVAVKISGLGMGDHMAGRKWTPATIRPWVESCIEIFGIHRSFFGTNWPIDKMYSEYQDIVEAYTSVIQGYSLEERVALLSANAERVYRI